MLDPIGLRLSRETWEREVRRARNTSRQYRVGQWIRRRVTRSGVGPPREPIPHWKQWDSQRTDRFWEICGPTMRRFGYEP